ncbi:MAG: DMT family transporter [Hyphomicrobiales bacterium]|nr:DMT family transporter [Hyphomicrobiales bacterium]
MNFVKAVLLKVLAAFLFALMSVLVRWLSERYPVGQMVFYRSAFAILPVVIIYAWRRELMAAIRIGRPLDHLGRGLTAVCAMFGNFSALARLPVVDATAISFVSPLMTVALSAIFLRERVRVYRWSAVIVGFAGVLVMLSPHLDLERSAAHSAAVAGALFGLAGAFFSACSTVQTRSLARSETTSSIVLYFSLVCALAGLVTLPLGWETPGWGELAALVTIGIIGGLAHIFLTESYRLAEASLVAPFDYTSMLWALLLGYLVFSELPDALVFVGAAIIAAAGLFVIWRERKLGLKRVRDAEGPPAP